MNETATIKTFHKKPEVSVFTGEKTLSKNAPKDFFVDSTEAEEMKDSTLLDYDYLRITKEKNIPNPQATITINDASLASPGNITGFSAPSKSGKTAVVGALMSGALNKTGDVNGFPDLKVLPNESEKAVLHFDSEQSEADQQSLVKAVLRRADLETTPDYYYSYNIRQLNLEEYETFTNTVCALASQKHNGIHLIAIDAAADYIIDTNDLKDSRRIIKYFIDLSIKHQCPVIIITHLNPFTQKEMGHFGSVLQRKCYGLLTIDKQGEISTLSAKMVRKAGNSDVPPISFKYSKEQGYHVQVDSVDIDQEKVQKDRLKHLELAKKVFKPLVALQYKDAVSAIMKETSKGERTAKTMISNMSGWGYVKKFNDGFYRINNEEVQ